MAYSIQLPDGTLVENIPDEVDPSEAKRRIIAQHPELGGPADKQPGFLESLGAGVAGGVGKAFTGAGAGIASLAGADKTAAALDARTKAIQDWQQQHTGGSFTGEVGEVAGGMAPALGIQGAGAALAVPTGGLSVLAAEAVNAGFFGIPAFRDKYREVKAAGGSEAEAITQASTAAALATVGGSVVGKGGRAVSKVLPLGEGLAGKLGAAAVEGAAFPEIGRLGENVISEAYGRDAERPWLVSGREAAAGALGFAGLRGVQHPFEARKQAQVDEARAQAEKEAAAEAATARAAEDKAKRESRTYVQDQIDSYLDLKSQWDAARATSTAKLDPNSPSYTMDVENQKEAKNTVKELGKQLFSANAALKTLGVTPENLQERAAARKAPVVEAPAPVAIEATTEGKPGEEAPQVTAPAPFEPPKTVTEMPFYTGKSLSELQPHIDQAKASAAQLLEQAKHTTDPDELLSLMQQHKEHTDLAKRMGDEAKKTSKKSAADIAAEQQLVADYTSLTQQLAAEQAKKKPKPAVLADLATKLKANIDAGGKDAFARAQGRAEPTGPTAAEPSGEVEAQAIAEQHAAEIARHNAAMEAERNAPTGPTAAEPSGEPEAQAIAAETERVRQDRKDTIEQQNRARTYGEQRPTAQSDLFAPSENVKQGDRSDAHLAELHEELAVAKEELAASHPSSADYGELARAVQDIQTEINTYLQRTGGRKGTETPAINSAFEEVTATGERYGSGQYPTGATRESITAQLAQLPRNLHQNDSALVGRIQDNLPALSATPAHAEAVRELLHKMRVGAPRERDAAHVRSVLDDMERSGASEMHDVETPESVAARNKYAVSRQRISDLQQQVADLHNQLVSSPEGKRYAHLYDRLRNAMQHEADTKAAEEALDARVKSVEAYVAQLERSLPKAQSRAELEATATRIKQNNEDLKFLRVRLEKARKAYDAAREEKTKDRIALYANSESGVDPNRATAEKLEKAQQELIALTHEQAPTPEYQRTSGGVQKDMFPEIPGQGEGENYIPSTRSDISTFATPEEFRNFMAGTGLQRLREAQGLVGRTAEATQRLVKPVQARLDNLKANAEAAYKALQEKAGQTAEQRAELTKRRDEAAARLQLILDKIGVELAPLTRQREEAYAAVGRLQTELADLLRLRESRDEQLLHALDMVHDITAHKERYEEAKTSGATEAELGEMRIPAGADEALARVSAEIERLSENAPAQLRAMNKQRKELEKKLAEANAAIAPIEQAYAEAAEPINKFYAPERKKVATEVSQANKALNDLGEAPKPAAEGTEGERHYQIGQQNAAVAAREAREVPKQEQIMRDLEQQIADIKSGTSETERNAPPPQEMTRAERDTASADRWKAEQAQLEQWGFFNEKGELMPFVDIKFEGHRKLMTQHEQALGIAGVYKRVWDILKAREAGGEENPTMPRADGDTPITVASAEASYNRAMGKANRIAGMLDREGENKQAKLDSDVAAAQKKVDEWRAKKQSASTALGVATRKANKEPTPENIAAKEAATKARNNANDSLSNWQDRLTQAKAVQEKGPGISGVERTPHEEKILAALRAEYVPDPNYEPKTPEEARLLEAGALPMFHKSVLMRRNSSAAGHGFRTSSPESRGEVRQLWLMRDGTIRRGSDNAPLTRTVGPHENPVNKPQETRAHVNTPFGKSEIAESNRIAKEIGPAPTREAKPIDEGKEGAHIASDLAESADRQLEETNTANLRDVAEQSRKANEEAEQLRKKGKPKAAKKSRLVEPEEVSTLPKVKLKPVKERKNDTLTKSERMINMYDVEEPYSEWDNDIIGRGTSGKNDTPLAVGAIGALNNGNLQGALSHIAANSKNPIAKRLAGQFAKLVGNVKVHLVDEMPGENPNAPGGTTRNGLNVLLHRDHGLSEETLVHEVGHALSIHMLDLPEHLLTADQRAAKRELEAMHEEIKKADDLDNPVIKQDDLKEFVAEGWGSRMAQQYMGGRDWQLGAIGMGKAQYAASRAAGKGRVRSMFDAFKSAAMRLIGMKTPPSGPMHDRFMELADKFMRAPEAGDTAARGEEVAHYRDPLTAALKHGFGDERTLKQKGEDVKGHVGLAIRQNVADQRAALREVMSRIGTRDDKAETAMLVSALDAAPSNTMATLAHGAFKLDKKGQLVAGGGTSFHDVLNEIAKFPGIKGQEAINLWQVQRVADRADAMPGGWHILAGAEAKEWQAKAAAVRAKINANPALKAAVDKANDTYNEYNRGKLQLVKDSHVLPEQVIDAMMKDKNYVPYYRKNGDTVELIMPDGSPRSVGDIRTNPMLHALEGGNQALLGAVDGEVKNTHLLTNLAVMNVAKQNLAKRFEDLGKTRAKMPAGKPSLVVRRGRGQADPNAMVFRVEPVDAQDDGMRHLIVDTKGTIAQDIPSVMVSQALAGSYSTHNALVELSHKMSSVLRSGVTRFPLYTLKQLLKEPFAASVQGNVASNPLSAIAKSIFEYGRIMANASPEAKKLAAHGIIHSNVFGGTNDLNKVARQITSGSSWWHDKVLAALDKSAMAADAATRTQAYKDVLARGGSETEALLQAREMQNFSRRGSAAWAQFFSHSIPFFNSSIQSLDNLQRSARGKMPNEQLMQTKKAFAMRAAGMLAMVGAYYAQMQDDPKWQKLSLRDKISYIHLPVEFGGEPLRLPAPFEIGMLLYSLPIAAMESMRKDFTKEDWKTVWDVFSQQLPGNGSVMPLAARIPSDLMRNYNSGTGQAIVPQSQQGLAPEQQYGSKTSEAARRAGEALGMSPTKIDYAVQSLVGQWAGLAGYATDSLFRKESEAKIEKPSGHLSEVPGMSSFFQGQRSDDDMNHVYEAANQAKEAKNTFADLMKRGSVEDAKQYAIEHKVDIALAPALAGFSSELRNLKLMEDRIRAIPNMSGKEKQDRLDMISERRKIISGQYETMLKQIKR